MTKSALLIKMIDLLRRCPGISITELAVALRRSERTVYRWLNELSVDLRSPIYCSEGGYYLLDTSESTSAELTPEEMLALRLSLRSAPFSEGWPISKYAESAWMKIRNNSTNEKLSQAMSLADTHAVSITAPVSNIDPQIVNTLENAVVGRQRLRALYRSQRSNDVKDYVIDPYALVFRRHSWYLLAYSKEHQRVVQFKLARFRCLVDTGENFTPSQGFSVEDFFRYSWEVWASGDPVQVKVWFSPRVAQMICETKRHPTQVVHRQEDGSIIFEATVAGIEEIAIWILGYGKDAEVIEPDALRTHIIDHVRSMLDRYAKSEKKKLIGPSQN